MAILSRDYKRVERRTHDVFAYCYDDRDMWIGKLVVNALKTLPASQVTDPMKTSIQKELKNSMNTDLMIHRA